MELRETTIPPFPLRDLGMRKAGECRSTQGWEHWRQQARSEHTAVQKRDPRLEKLTAPATVAGPGSTSPQDLAVRKAGDRRRTEDGSDIQCYIFPKELWQGTETLKTV